MPRSCTLCKDPGSPTANGSFRLGLRPRPHDGPMFFEGSCEFEGVWFRLHKDGGRMFSSLKDSFINVTLRLWQCSCIVHPYSSILRSVESTDLPQIQHKRLKSHELIVFLGKQFHVFRSTQRLG